MRRTLDSSTFEHLSVGDRIKVCWCRLEGAEREEFKLEKEQEPIFYKGARPEYVSEAKGHCHHAAPQDCRGVILYIGVSAPNRPRDSHSGLIGAKYGELGFIWIFI
ncbi:hypothetical protein KQX54_005128 [Cotesia glomerata]|uniref:Uncharacterized protein n=1 Tax=Cotesia glomerata TaxID=32391 RepID=A0AAV7HXI5_COTGL|nr:hypothetical protein KQX54_005128 [Cotesia glomerata]